MQSRRTFIRSISAAGVAAGIGRSAYAGPSALDGYPRAGDSQIKELTARALDAAKAAGASYADVRLTLTRSEFISVYGISQWSVSSDDEHAALGVRALADGAWGFASGPAWSLDEASRLGREAAVQAKTNARGKRRKVELGNPPPVVVGEWVMPIKRDPFTVPLSEKLEVVWALAEVATRIDAPAQIGTYISLSHRRQEKTFASSDGSFITQTCYFTQPYCVVSASDSLGRTQVRTLDTFQPATAGWESLTIETLATEIPIAAEEAVAKLDAEFIAPDKYDVVFDALATAQILGSTIGVATEFDRAYGYEANAGGTSYLAPPEEMVGKFALAPSLLNVTANRSAPMLAATVKWDDEGIVPQSYQVIKNGIVVDYHSNRETGVLAGTQSRGCAGSESADRITTVQTPNIEMTPGAQDSTLDDLIAGMERGLVVLGGSPTAGSRGTVNLDRQQLNGEITGQTVYMVRKGKRTTYIKNAECLFRAPELWKSLKAIGGKRSVMRTGATVSKGQPSQQLSFGISAVPALFTSVAVSDIARRI